MWVRLFLNAALFSPLVLGAATSGEAADLGVKITDVNKMFNSAARELDVTVRVLPPVECRDAIIGSTPFFEASQTTSCIYRFNSIEFEAIAVPASDDAAIIQASTPLEGATKQNAADMTLFTLMSMHVFGKFQDKAARSKFVKSVTREMEDNGRAVRVAGPAEFTYERLSHGPFQFSLQPKENATGG